MGHVRVPVRIINPYSPDRFVDASSALVDTGATRTLIPRAVAEQLELQTESSREVRTAEGVQRLQQAAAIIELQGESTFGDVWISDTFPGVLIGVITLESLGLAVDPTNQRLVKTEFLLL